MLISRCLSVTAALLLATATMGRAQQTDTPPLRWYAGAGPTLEHRVFLVGGETSAGYLLGGQVYGGYALRPGLTLQVGLQHGRGGSLDDNHADDGTPKYVPNSYKNQVWGVPLELRVLLSDPQRPLQVEGLFGGGIYRVRQTHTYNRLRTYVSTDGWDPIITEGSAMNSYFTFGLGLRYVCTPRISTGLDVAVNGLLKRAGQFGVGVGGSTALGLHYHF